MKRFCLRLARILPLWTIYLISPSLHSRPLTAQDVEIAPVWMVEASAGIAGNDSERGLVKFENRFRAEVEAAVGNIDITAIPEVSYDTETELADDQGGFELREAYADFDFSNTYWRVGKQQIVWGQSDGFKVLDVVNPQDYREFILDEFDDSRIALWSLNLEFSMGYDDVLSFVWVPDLKFNEMPDRGSRFEISSAFPPAAAASQLPITFTPVSEPDSGMENHEYGLRYASFVGGWELSANYFYHYHDNPVVYLRLLEDSVEAAPVYERNRMLGGRANKAFGNFIFRTEIAFNSNVYYQSTDASRGFVGESDQILSVVGLDYMGVSDTLLSFQWFRDHLVEDKDAMLGDRTHDTLTALYRRTFANESWTFESFVMHSGTKGDGLIRTSLSHMLRTHIEVHVGADIFYGDSDEVFGQFDSNDQINLGVVIGF